jgi:hypothetical protein
MEPSYIALDSFSPLWRMRASSNTDQTPEQRTSEQGRQSMRAAGESDIEQPFPGTRGEAVLAAYRQPRAQQRI